MNKLANSFHHISFSYLRTGDSFRTISFNFKMRNKKHSNLPDFFNSSPICTHNFSFHTLSLYFLFDMSYNSHIYAKILLIIYPFLKTIKWYSLQTNTQSVVEVTYLLFTLLESSRFRTVRTRSVTSNFLARRRRRNVPET